MHACVVFAPMQLGFRCTAITWRSTLAAANSMCSADHQTHSRSASMPASSHPLVQPASACSGQTPPAVHLVPQRMPEDGENVQRIAQASCPHCPPSTLNTSNHKHQPPWQTQWPVQGACRPP